MTRKKPKRPRVGDLVMVGDQLWEVLETPARRVSFLARPMVGTTRERIAGEQLLYLRHVTGLWVRVRK